MTKRVWPVATALFVVTVAVYLYNLQYRYWGAGGDTTPAELLPLTLFRDGDLYFEEFASGVAPSGELPFYFSWGRDGRIVSSYPILPGFLNVPVYAIAVALGVPLDSAHRAMLSMISASLISAGSVLFFYLAALHIVTKRTALFAALLYAFGTAVFSVAARGMWQHGPGLLFLTCALWLLARGTGPSVALSGLFLGFAVFTRPPNLLIVAPLALYVTVRYHRSVPAFIACAAIPAALLFWYSYTHWGSIVNMGQYPVVKSNLDLFSGEKLMIGIAGLLVSPSRGLFVFTPVFLFSFVGFARVLRHPARQPLLTALVAGVLLTIPLYATWYSWWGGSCYGYRLLTELVPALVLIAAWAWEALPPWKLVNALLVIAAAFSLYANFLGAYYYPCGFNYEPNEINAHPERLWSVRDGELARCSAKLWDRIESRF